VILGFESEETAMLLGIVLALASSGAEDWASYTNVRYGFTACYPRSALTPQREADNGDGRRFTAADGAQLATYGTNGAEGDFRRELRSFEADIVNAGGKVTYRAGGKSWGVISGSTASKVFYVKAISRADQVLVFDFEYPRANAQKYDSIVAPMERCFRIGTPGY
jgi:hypothetical protein